MRRKLIDKIFHRLLLIVFLLVALAPVYWMLNTAFKTESEVLRREPTLFPEKITFDNFIAIFKDKVFVRSMWNSLLVSLVVVLFSIVVAFPAAYSIARFNFKGRRIYSKSILFGYLLPAAIMYLPLYIINASLHLTNTLLGLMVIYPSLTLPYACWVLIPHMRSIPKEIEEAAIIDGCSRFGVLWRIALPLSMNGIATTGIFAFNICWGEYLYALVNNTSKSVKTMPLVISDFIFGDVFPWGKIMAAGIVSCIPVLVLYILSNSVLSPDRSSGGVKG